MIKRITYNHDHNCFFEGDTFELKPITLLVGDQGCGKSTTLSVIDWKFRAKRNEDLASFETADEGITKVLYLDTEKMNPAIMQANPEDGEDMKSKLLSRFESHGQTLFPILRSLEELDEKTLIILDEPETALSLRSQFQMIEIFRKLAEDGCQIIMATHNLTFMEAFPDSVLSLEHMKYVTPGEFVELQRGPNVSYIEREDRRVKRYHCTQGVECPCAEDMGRYDNRCFHFIDRDGTSGWDRRVGGMRGTKKEKREYFKNAPK